MSAADPANRPPSVMEDPSTQSVARVYALALLDAVKDGNLETVLEEFASFLTDVLDAHPRFDQILNNALTSTDDQLRLIDRVVAPVATPLFANFLRVLARHGRFGLIRAVYAGLQREIETRSGRLRVTVSSATALSDGALQDVKARLAETLQVEPLIEAVVDPDLLGGLVIRVGDTVYDGSVKNRLKQLRGRLRERCLNEVQRGRDRFSHPAGN